MAETIILQIVDKIEELNTLINDAQIVKSVGQRGWKRYSDYQEWVTNEAKNTLEDKLMVQKL